MDENKAELAEYDAGKPSLCEACTRMYAHDRRLSLVSFMRKTRVGIVIVTLVTFAYREKHRLRHIFTTFIPENSEKAPAENPLADESGYRQVDNSTDGFTLMHAVPRHR